MDATLNLFSLIEAAASLKVNAVHFFVRRVHVV